MRCQFQVTEREEGFCQDALSSRTVQLISSASDVWRHCVYFVGYHHNTSQITVKLPTVSLLSWNLAFITQHVTLCGPMTLLTNLHININEV